MIFTQHYLACLSQASYFIGDETTGRAVVVDPRRDIDEYLEEAAEYGLSIERVIETHIHADFLSGHLELAAATGALISFGEGADVEFPIELLRDGQRISLGEVTLEILATPGHTPESICIVVYQHVDDEIPYGVLTGDTLFVGDVGRPDLFERSGCSADALAQTLFASLHDKLLKLPDSTRVFPAHGAGSPCGKQLSSETSSTIGEQRHLSPDRDIVLVGDAVHARESKIRLSRVGFDRVVGQLRDLAEVFGVRPDLVETSKRLTIEQLAELHGLEPRLQLVDVRGPQETAGGSIPGAVVIPLAAIADSIDSFERGSPVVVYCASGYRSMVAASLLRARGFDDGSDVLGGFGAWHAAGLVSSWSGE